MPFASVKQYAQRKSVSEKTVYRMIDHKKLNAEKVEGQWRIHLSERDILTSTDMGAHQASIVDVLDSAAIEVGRLVRDFPRVATYPRFIDDPTNTLHRITKRDSSQVELQLNVESEPVWPYARRHLQTGLPNALKSISVIKASFGIYWQRISEFEDQMRLEVKEALAGDDRGVEIDEANFFRGVLTVVDEVGPLLEGRYEIRELQSGISVPGVVTAPNEEVARNWLKRHKAFRQQLVTSHRSELTELRIEVMNEAELFVQATNEIEIRGRVEGECDICSQL